MPNATVRANARPLPEATSCPDANIRALAAQFETALQAYNVFFHGGGTDDEAAAATLAVKAVAQKIVAVPGTDISIMRLKARVYLWAESTDLEGGDWPSEAVLASLFRDLGVADSETIPGPATMADRAPDEDAEIHALRAEYRQVHATYLPVESQWRALNFAFDVIHRAKGFEAAKGWGQTSGYDSVNDENTRLVDHCGEITQRMTKRRPKTLAGIAAMAATIKEDQSHFWKNPEEDRDWDILLVTRFLDGLIELRQAPTGTDLSSQDREARA